jgi:hypothetical protein
LNFRGFPPFCHEPGARWNIDTSERERGVPNARTS